MRSDRASARPSPNSFTSLAFSLLVPMNAQIVQFAAHRRDLVRERIAQEREMAFSHEGRHYANHQKQKEPGRVDDYSDRQRKQGDRLQQQPAHRIQHPDAIRRLLTRPLQHIMEPWIFEQRQVQLSGVLDQSQAHLARKLMINDSCSGRNACGRGPG